MAFHVRRVLIPLVAAVASYGCGDEPTGPEVELQVIEETTFAPSLNVDLPSMMRLASGVYVEDLVEGTGNAAVFGSNIRIGLQGWLSDGTQWLDNEETLFFGNTPAISGLEDAVLNMRVGGVRQAVIPPGRAYGAVALFDAFGNLLVPAGAIVVLEIELLAAEEVP